MYLSKFILLFCVVLSGLEFSSHCLHSRAGFSTLNPLELTFRDSILLNISASMSFMLARDLGSRDSVMPAGFRDSASVAISWYPVGNFSDTLKGKRLISN